MNWSDSKLSKLFGLEVKKCYDPWQNVDLIDTYYKNSDEDKG